jgi:hypothetical protein
MDGTVEKEISTPAAAFIPRRLAFELRDDGCFLAGRFKMLRT